MPTARPARNWTLTDLAEGTYFVEVQLANGISASPQGGEALIALRISATMKSLLALALAIGLGTLSAAFGQNLRRYRTW